MLMWWPVLSPLPELPRIAPTLQMLYLFVLGVPMMVAAAMITFSGSPLYTFYVEAPRVFNLTALEDQQLGGAIMWVPGALVIWIAITLVYYHWSQRDGADDQAAETGRVMVTRSGMVLAPPPFPDQR
jgi:putative membrane protein